MASSAKMVPVLQTSTGVEYRAEPRRTSGARYHRVTTWEHRDSIIALICLPLKVSDALLATKKSVQVYSLVEQILTSWV